MWVPAAYTTWGGSGGSSPITVTPTYRYKITYNHWIPRLLLALVTIWRQWVILYQQVPKTPVCTMPSRLRRKHTHCTRIISTITHHAPSSSAVKWASMQRKSQLYAHLLLFPYHHTQRIKRVKKPKRLLWIYTHTYAHETTSDKNTDTRLTKFGNWNENSSNPLSMNNWRARL